MVYYNFDKDFEFIFVIDVIGYFVEVLICIGVFLDEN